MSLRDYMRKTGFSARDRRGVGRHRLGAGAGDRRRRARRRTACRRSTCRRATTPRHDPVDRGSGSPRRSACATASIPIQEIDEPSARVFEAHAHPIAQGLTRENLHARIRGLLMMAESNDTGALLISCGNETEIALGYATLYGDMCGGMSLIGDLSKTDVYRLARYVNAQARPRDHSGGHLHIKPSAELAAGQFDPFDYAVVAPIVGEFVERRTSPAELVRLFERRALDPVRFAPDDRGAHALRQVHGRELSRRSSTTPRAGCAARSTSGCRARRSSSSPNAPSASTCAKPSSTAGKGNDC